MRNTLLVLGSLLIVAIVGGQERASNPVKIEWSMEMPWVKISEHYPFADGKRYLLMAARNEFAPIQIILDVTPIRGAAPKISICTEISELASESGEKRYAPEDQIVRVFRQASINTTGKSARKSLPGAYFDPLIPVGDWSFPSIASGASSVGIRPASAEVLRLDDIDLIEADGRSLAVFWVDTFIPFDAEGGVYETTLRLSPLCNPQEVEPVDATLKIAVANFDIPSTSSLPTMFEWNMDAACSALFGGEEGDPFCSDVHKARIADLFGRFMLEHRVSLKLDPGNRPDAQSYLNFMRPFVEGTVDFGNPAIFPGARVTSLSFPWSQLNQHLSETDMENDMKTWEAALTGEGPGWRNLALHKVGDEPPGNSSWTGHGSVENQANIADRVGVPSLLTADVQLVQGNAAHLLSGGLIDILTVNLTRMDHWDSSNPYWRDQRGSVTVRLAAS